MMAKDIKTKRIDEELVCMDALVHSLKHHHGYTQVNVQRENNDPPDFWITINGERFAAEVTSIVTGESYRAICRKLYNVIEKRWAEEDFAGKYTLRISRQPELPKYNSPEWHQLVCKAIAFIHATQTVSFTEDTSLMTTAHGHIDIRKITSKGENVGLVEPLEGRWEGEIHIELHQIMQEAITKKYQQLNRKGVQNDCSQIILLLYDAYGYGDSKDAQKALLKAVGYDWFHSIFWAASFTDRSNILSPRNHGREGIFLYSKNKTWWKSPIIDHR